MKYDVSKRYEAMDPRRAESDADGGHLMYLTWSEQQSRWFGNFCDFATLPAALRELRRYYGREVVIREAA